MRCRPRSRGRGSGWGRSGWGRGGAGCAQKPHLKTEFTGEGEVVENGWDSKEIQMYHFLKPGK